MTDTFIVVSGWVFAVFLLFSLVVDFYHIKKIGELNRELNRELNDLDNRVFANEQNYDSLEERIKDLKNELDFYRKDFDNGLDENRNDINDIMEDLNNLSQRIEPR